MYVLLTQGFRAVVDEIDADLATLSWHTSRDGQIVYARRNVKVGTAWTTETLHRRVGDRMGIAGEVDHRDRDGLNCRRQNLRSATRAQNGSNRGIQRNNTSGYKGVTLHKASGRWQARIKVETKMKALGYFDDPASAAVAYDLAALKYHGEFAALNFPLDSLLGS